jgi:hypothetical protein
MSEVPLYRAAGGFQYTKTAVPQRDGPTLNPYPVSGQ